MDKGKLISPEECATKFTHGSLVEKEALQKQYDKALNRAEGYGRIITTRCHEFTVDACGGDAELICVLQKVMERFTERSGEDIAEYRYGELTADKSAVAEWFYARYGARNNTSVPVR